MKRGITMLALATLAGLAFAADPETVPKVITMSLNEDVLSLVKGAIWVGGVFLAIFAFIGVAFFGWDVRKARASITDAQKEVQQSLEAMRKDAAALKELKEKLEETGAQVQEFMEKNHSSPVQAAGARTNLDLIREVIQTSNYTWTTVGRIMKRTGLDKDTILKETRAAPDIEIGFGKQSQDQIFRFKNAG